MLLFCEDGMWEAEQGEVGYLEALFKPLQTYIHGSHYALPDRPELGRAPNRATYLPSRIHLHFRIIYYDSLPRSLQVTFFLLQVAIFICFASTSRKSQIVRRRRIGQANRFERLDPYAQGLARFSRV